MFKIKILCWNFPIPQKKILLFIKYFLEKKIFIKSPYHKKEKKRKEKNPSVFSKHSITHHQKNNALNFLKNTTFLPWITTKLLPPMPPKKQPFGLIPIRQNIHLPQSLKKNLLWKRSGITPSSPPHPKKPFWKVIFFNPSSPFLKASLTTCNSFNIIELSTPYTYWNPIIKKNPWKRKKKTKIFNLFALPKFSPINPIVTPPNFIN